MIATILLLSIQWAAKPENAESQLSHSERMVGIPETGPKTLSLAFKNQVLLESRGARRTMLKNKGLRGLFRDGFWKGTGSMPVALPYLQLITSELLVIRPETG